MTMLSGRTKELERMLCTARCVDGFRQQMSGLVGIIMRLIDDQGPIVLHVTAATEGDGTSLIAHGLAVATAQSRWCKVALLDASLPRNAVPPGNALPSVLRAFDATQAPQLIPQTVGDTEMSVGSLDLAASAMPNIEGMRALYGRLRNGFTLTIIDYPPVNGSKALAAYAKLADGVLLVVSAERTQVTEVEQALARLEQAEAMVLGIVMNRHRRRVPRFLDRLL